MSGPCTVSLNLEPIEPEAPIGPQSAYPSAHQEMLPMLVEPTGADRGERVPLLVEAKHQKELVPER